MERISTFNELSIVVIGDVMLDSYWYGDTQRISPEAPVPVVRVQTIDKRPGGAANVALNIKSIGAHVTLLGMCGNDDEGMALEASLNALDIEHKLIKHETHSTINKLRVLSQSQQLMRLDFERSYENADKSELKLAFVDSLKNASMVVISDYAKGTLTDIPFLIEQCKKHHIPVLIDPKGDDYAKYKGATLLTPNRKEFELVMGESASTEEFFEKGQKMLKDYHLESLLVTRGAQGMTLFRYSDDPYHLDANAKSVYDVTGAGDTVIGVLSTCLASGMAFESSLKLANYAAGLVVAQVGAATVSSEDLKLMEKSQFELSYNDFLQLLKQHDNENKTVYRVDFETLNSGFDDWYHCIHLEKKGAFIYAFLTPLSSLEEQKKAISLLSNLNFIEGIVCLTQEQREGLNSQTLKVL